MTVGSAAVTVRRALRRAAAGARRRLAGDVGCFILLYHRIAEVEQDPWNLCVSPAHFGEHLRVLRKHCQPMRLTELAHAAERSVLPGSAFAVTFDDGYADNLVQGLPRLAHFEVPATVFLATGYAGRGLPFWWDELQRIILQPGPLSADLQRTLGRVLGQERLDPAACGEQMPQARVGRTRRRPPTAREILFRNVWRALGALPGAERRAAVARLVGSAATLAGPADARALSHEEVHALGAGGIFEFGAHTVSHPALPDISLEQQRMEVERSRADVLALTGTAPSTFAYPHGRFAAETVDIVRDSGFSVACAVSNHPSDANLAVARWNPLLLPRIHVLDWDGAEFERRLQRGFGG